MHWGGRVWDRKQVYMSNKFKYEYRRLSCSRATGLQLPPLDDIVYHMAMYNSCVQSPRILIFRVLLGRS